MLKGENINGYIILQDHIVAGGMSKISFASKGGKEYFIKEFLSPKYPLPGSPGSERVKEQKRKACQDFENHHCELNRKIATKVALGGNLVFAVDFFRWGTCYYKVTEKIDTASLSCRKISELKFKDILIIMRSVCHSVRILHDLNIVHGDLKPDNILIKKTVLGGYTGKLIDFDDSYFSGKPPKDRASLVGTPEYYSPEQAAYIKDEDDVIDGATLTLKSDIFTLGIIFCEYFTGQKPIMPSDDVKTAWLCAQKNLPFNFAKKLPEDLALLILKMLSLQPDKRPTINEVFNVLKAFKLDGGESPRKPTGIRTSFPIKDSIEEHPISSPTSETSDKPKTKLRGDLAKIMSGGK